MQYCTSPHHSNINFAFISLFFLFLSDSHRNRQHKTRSSQMNCLLLIPFKYVARQFQLAFSQCHLWLFLIDETDIHQLNLIMEVLGTPAQEFMQKISSESVSRLLKAFSVKVFLQVMGPGTIFVLARQCRFGFAFQVQCQFGLKFFLAEITLITNWVFI